MFYMPQIYGHGTDGFTSSPEGRRAEDFFALKNPTASAGFEPANLVTKGQHATPRPPKHCIYVFCIYLRTNSDLCHLQHKLIDFYNQTKSVYSAVRTGSLNKAVCG